MSGLLVGAGLAGAAVGADLLAAHLGVRRARRTLSDALGTDVTIRLRGWPHTPRLLFGSGLRAVLSATDVPLPESDVTLIALAVHLRDVRIDRGRSGRPERLRTSGGRFDARLDAEAVRALTPVPGLRQVLLEDDRIRYGLPGGVTVTGRLTVDTDGELIFTPEGGPLGTFSLVRIAAPIGRLPLGATIEDVGTGSDAIVVQGSIGASSVDLRPG